MAALLSILVLVFYWLHSVLASDTAVVDLLGNVDTSAQRLLSDSEYALFPNNFPCSWPLLGTLETWNIAYPEASCVYWTMPLSLDEGSEITISGEFPGARYFSYITYNVDGSSHSGSTLYDQQLGSTSGTNYYNEKEPAPMPPTGKYSLKVVGGDPSLTKPAEGDNIAVLAAPYGRGVTGWLMYRIYEPFLTDEDNSNQGLVDLPVISIDGEALDRCDISPGTEQLIYWLLTAVLAVIMKPVYDKIPDPTDVGEWSFSNGEGIFPNYQNKYIRATVKTDPEYYLIVTGVAPTFPATYVDAIIQTPPTEVRFWSLCTNGVNTPGPTVACASDGETTLFQAKSDTIFQAGVADDALEGLEQYAYVFTGPDKPSSLPFNFTWLPLYTGDERGGRPDSSLLILRHMLPAESFAQAIHNIADEPDSSTPEAAEKVMGVYLPRGLRCKASVFDTEAEAEGSTVSSVIEKCMADQMAERKGNSKSSKKEKKKKEKKATKSSKMFE